MIVWQDGINGTFELLGAPFICLSILRIHKEKAVKGVHWMAAAFFASWGYWNLYYYPHLHQWCSFVGGCAIVVANTVWVGQMLYYIRKNKNDTARCDEAKGNQQEPEGQAQDKKHCVCKKP